MKLCAKDYIGLRQSEIREPEIAKILLGVTESERLAFIEDMLAVNSLVALSLARRTLKERKSFVRILELSLDRANASSIRYWLESVVFPLGVRRVFAHLKGYAEFKPEAVSKARYWMPMFKDAPGFRRQDLAELDSRLADFLGTARPRTRRVTAERAPEFDKETSNN